jgi:hypothetical protein
VKNDKVKLKIYQKFALQISDTKILNFARPRQAEGEAGELCILSRKCLRSRVAGEQSHFRDPVISELISRN